MTVSKDRALSVSAIASGGDIEPIDIRELQFLGQDGFVAFRYFKQPVKLELSSNKFDIQAMVETVVSKCLVEMVLDRTGVATTRCRYVLKSSERQRLRIDLPANVEILGVLVDRKLTALEKSGIAGDKAWDSYFISVARTKSSDEPLSLSVVFRHPLNPAPFQNAGGMLALRLPIIGGAANAGLAVQQMHVKIWVPPEYSLVGTPKNFSVQTRSRFRELFYGRSNPAFGEQNLEGWIGHDTGGVFDFPTEGKWFQYMNLGGSKQLDVTWWHIPFYTLIVSEGARGNRIRAAKNIAGKQADSRADRTVRRFGLLSEKLRSGDSWLASRCIRHRRNARNLDYSRCDEVHTGRSTRDRNDSTAAGTA